METDQHSPHFWTAVRDFRRARQQAILENIVAHLTGKSADLLSYEDVYELVKEEKPVERGLQEIPLAAIVGSVGRYTDFSRSFLPRRKSDQQHWAEVKAFVDSAGEIPPITVYKLDQVYFVLDGNHRVSIARQSGLTHIKAYVTEIRTPVPLSPDLQPDEIIIATQYADFLEETNLATFRPGADLRVTAPGQYRILKEQIEVHRHWLSQKEDQPISYQEAVTHWYDDLYLPTVQIIRQRGILRDFPERTETDLYVWLSKHQVEMKQALG